MASGPGPSVLPMSRRPHPDTNHGLRLRHLWLAYLLAMLFHVELGLMPLFHGLSPAIESQVPPSQLKLVFWAMLLYFLIPLASLLLITYADSAVSQAGDRGSAPDHPRQRRAGAEGVWRRWRRFHFGLSLVYSVTNIAHLIADIVIPDARSDQVFLMVVLLAIGLLINREAWLWWRAAR
jgi:hypothetical protein